MLAKDLMQREVFTVREDQPVADLIDLVVREHIHGCPVVDGAGKLVGIVTQQDIFVSDVGGRAAKTRVKDLMTSPAVTATEETDVVALCKLMHRLRIHRIPIVDDGEVKGIVSSLDIIGRLALGQLPG